MSVAPAVSTVPPRRAEGALLSVSGLCVTLGGNEILRGVSCRVRRGELVGIVGPNGSGKTTLLRTMAGLLNPAAGRVELDSADAAGLTARERARSIAYLPQSSSSGLAFTAFEVALMGRYPRLGRFQLESGSDRDIAMNALERTETSQFADRRLGDLSGGERQRVLMARTLAQEPDLLLLDEPTSNLDLKHQLGLMALVRGEVANGMAAVAVLHDLSLAARFADRMILLSNGLVMAEGTPEEVLTPENLLDAFEVDAAVSPDPLTGRPRIALRGPSGRTPAAPGRAAAHTIHLVCGAGSGHYLMQSLASAGYTVTAGILGEGDTDREAANHLGVTYVPSLPFSPASEEERRAGQELARAADLVVVCDMPVGSGNLSNLEAALQARSLVLVDDRPFSDRDHTDGEAAAIYGRLQRRAARLPARDALAGISALLEGRRS